MGSRAMCAIALVVALVAPRAWAEPTATEKETARNLMDEGRDLREKNDNKGALARFAAADQIMRVPTTAVEVASTQVALGMLVEARETLARVLSSQPKPGEPIQFKEARTKAQNLDDAIAAKIPTLVISLSGPSAGASVTIDGVALPASVIGLPSRANPGHHVLVATTKDGEGRGEVDLREAEKKEITITIVSHAPDHDATITPTIATKQPKAGLAKPLAMVFFAVGGASLVVGGVTGALTFSTQSDLSTKCPKHICGPSSHDELAMASTLGLVSTISFIGAGVFAVGGLVTWLVAKPSRAPPPTAHVEPWLGVGALGLRGEF